MRIISGTRRGHKLTEFSGDDIRPTTDRVKEAVFNLIQAYVPDAVMLDLFSGSGALSFEALSRGALRAVCVDKDKRSVDVIRKNAASLRFEDKCEIVCSSCFDYMAGTKEKFDIIFLDPPYNKGFIEPVLSAIAKNCLLNEDGIIVLESDGTDYRDETAAFSVMKQRRYGRTYITVYSADKGKEINENSSISGKL